MSTTSPPSAAQQPDTQSTAQKMDEINRLLTETNLLHARQAKARAEREARFYARFPLFAQHEWLLPAITMGAGIGVGVVLAKLI